MKIRVGTADLSRALYRVQGIADRKSSMPVLAHVLLEASEGRPAEEALTVSATDTDVGLAGSYPAEVISEGAVAVQARQLYDVVKSLSADAVELERQENNWIEIKAGSSRFRLVGMAPEQFPELPSCNDVDLFAIEAGTLARMIERTIFCVSTDDNRHNLSGVYCEPVDETVLRMVSTDGHRLALAERQLETSIPFSEGVIVPRKGFQELRRVLGDSQEKIEKVEVGFSKNNGLIRAGKVTLSTRLVEGQFPDYNQVIPQGFDKTAKINRAQLTDSLRRVSLLSQGRTHGVRLKFSENLLELTAEDPEVGEAREAIDIEYDGKELLMGFNAKYLLDVMSLISDDAVIFQLTDDLSPGVIKPLEEEGFLSVIMPMRI